MQFLALCSRTSLNNNRKKYKSERILKKCRSCSPLFPMSGNLYPSLKNRKMSFKCGSVLVLWLKLSLLTPRRPPPPPPPRLVSISLEAERWRRSAGTSRCLYVARHFSRISAAAKQLITRHRSAGVSRAVSGACQCQRGRGRAKHESPDAAAEAAVGSSVRDASGRDCVALTGTRGG